MAVDIGGSHVTAGLVELARAGRLPPARVVRMAADECWSAPRLLDAWASTASLAAAKAPQGMHIDAVGLAVPAPFDYVNGVSRMEHKFAALHSVRVAEALRARWVGDPRFDAVAIRFGNDGDLWTLGEACFGAGIGARKVIGITIGTGLGSGFVADGVVVRSGVGVPPDSELWSTPFNGATAEDAASGRSLGDSYARRLLGGTRRGAADETEPVPGEEIARRARHGDSNAQDAFTEMGRSLGRVLRPWAISFEADVVVVGGSIAHAWNLFAAPLAEQLSGVRVVRTQLFEEATLRGAAELCCPS